MSKDAYRAVESDAEYLVNWVDKMDLLCTPHFKVGLIGSCYFIGIIITILPVPLLSDIYGRKTIYLASLILCVFAQFALIINSSIDVAFGLYVLLGMTFPGRNVVGLTYLLEFMH